MLEEEEEEEEEEEDGGGEVKDGGMAVMVKNVGLGLSMRKTTSH